MRSLVVIGILILVVVGPITSTAQPSNISIMSPTDGATLDRHLVNIAGNARGSKEVWAQKDSLDFSTGEKKNIIVDPSKGLLLEGGLYDDFHGDYLDGAKWSKSEAGGMMSSLENDTFSAWGTSTSNGGCENKIVSTRLFNDTVSATLLDFDGYGRYSAGFGINDSNNSVMAGFIYNEMLQYPIIIVETKFFGVSGFQCYYEPIIPQNVNISFSWNSTSISIAIMNFSTMYNISEGSTDNSYYCSILTRAGSTGDSVSASWDNVIGDKRFFGTYLSNVCDTTYSKPKIEKISWNASTFPGGAISVALRSSNVSDMIDSTEWIILHNNMVSGFSTINRYLQYCVTFTSEDGIYSPILHDISIVYDKKPVMKIEVSIDDRFSWLEANGTDEWYIILELRENTNMIWARAIHPAGDFDLVSITLEVDTTLPSGTIVINDGKAFTNDSNVIIGSNASDRYGVVSMMLSEDLSFMGETWQDYRASAPYALTSGDGLKAVYAKFKDNNGWESAIANDTITLDTTPPSTSISPLPAVVGKTDFAVCWTGSDASSGLQWFDVQCKDGDRAWIDWQSRTNSTYAQFSGIDGHRYSFRVRAQDNARNIQPYPETGSGFVLIQIPKPVVLIQNPKNNSFVQTGIVIEGSSSHQNANISIIKVYVQVDDGPWQTAEGTTRWTFNFDALNVRNGIHIIHVKAYDGIYYSPETSINLTVKIPDENVSINTIPLFIPILLATLTLFFIYLYIVRRLK